MKISIHQPTYLPWIGLFDKIDRSDVFVFLDDVQFEKNGFINRNRLKTPQGWQWLTIPVHYRFPMQINEVFAMAGNWKEKHFKSIVSNYGKSKYFLKYIDFFQNFYYFKLQLLSGNIVDITSELTIGILCEILGVNTQLYFNSNPFSPELEKNTHPTQRLIDICKQYNADVYLSGDSGKNYLDLRLFKKEGIEVEFQNFNHPVYEQLFGEFLPNMSIVDLIMNHGSKSLDIIRSCRL